MAYTLCVDELGNVAYVPGLKFAAHVEPKYSGLNVD